MLAFELCTNNKPDCPSPLKPRRHCIYDFQKGFQIFVHQTTFSTSPQSFLNELGSRGGGRIQVLGSCLVSSLHGRPFQEAVKNCVHMQWFSEMSLSPYSEFHYRIVSVFDAVPSEGPRITAIQISLDSLNLLMILSPEEDEIPKFFAFLCSGIL